MRKRAFNELTPVPSYYNKVRRGSGSSTAHFFPETHACMLEWPCISGFKVAKVVAMIVLNPLTLDNHGQQSEHTIANFFPWSRKPHWLLKPPLSKSSSECLLESNVIWVSEDEVRTREYNGR